VQLNGLEVGVWHVGEHAPSGVGVVVAGAVDLNHGRGMPAYCFSAFVLGKTGYA
jgi:hypothetical protein